MVGKPRKADPIDVPQGEESPRMYARVSLIRSIGLTVGVVILCAGPHAVGSAALMAQLPIPPPPLNVDKVDPLVLSRAFLPTGRSSIIVTAYDGISLDALTALIRLSAEL